MIIPRITKPYEPGLPALGDDLENYLVVAGGSVTLKLEPGDKFKIINLEGKVGKLVLGFGPNSRACVVD